SAGEPLGEPEPVTSQDGWVRSQGAVGAWSLQRTPEGNLDILQGGKKQSTITRYTNSYSLTPDGATVIFGGVNGVLAAYGRDGTSTGAFIGHEGGVFAVSVSPDGKYLISGSNDQTVRLWDVKTRALLVTLFYGSDGEWVMWTPEGFYTSSGKGAER